MVDSDQPDQSGVELLERLLALWDSIADSQESVEASTDGYFQSVLIYGTTAHTADVGRAALHLAALGSSVAVFPLARLMLEGGIVASWLASEAGSWREFVYKSMEDRVFLLNEIKKYGRWDSSFDVQLQEALAVSHRFKDSFRKRLTISAMADDLQGGGRALYTDYRLLSQFSHAGKPTADLYLRESNSARGGMIATRTAATDDSDIDVEIGIGASGLLQAMLAWDGCTTEHRLRNQLTEIARELGVRFTAKRV